MVWHHDAGTTIAKRAPKEEAVQCALWYGRYRREYYLIFNTEQKAAEMAVHLLESGEGNPHCVQFADGDVLLVENWPLFDEVREAQAEESDAARAAERMQPTRVVLAPLTDEPVTVPADAPRWLGRPL